MIERPVIGHYEMGPRRYLQPLGGDLDPFLLYLVNFFEEGLWIYDHPVSEHTNLVRVNNSGRQETQNKRPVTNINAVARIMPALITGHYVETVGKQVNYLALSLIAPLGADNDDYHNLLG